MGFSLPERPRVACLGMPVGLFFGPDGEPSSAAEAREAKALAVCRGCDVRAACLAFELTWPAGAQHGVAGGMTADERRAEIRRRRRTSRAQLVESRRELARILDAARIASEGEVAA